MLICGESGFGDQFACEQLGSIEPTLGACPAEVVPRTNARGGSSAGQTIPVRHQIRMSGRERGLQLEEVQKPAALVRIQDVLRRSSAVFADGVASYGAATHAGP